MALLPNLYKTPKLAQQQNHHWKFEVKQEKRSEGQIIDFCKLFTINQWIVTRQGREDSGDGGEIYIFDSSNLTFK